MIKQTSYGRLDYTALEVGDKVGYVSPWGGSEPKNAKAATVTKVTKKQVTVAGWSETESCTFMRESGRQVGATSKWRCAYLITTDQMERAKKQEQDIHSFQATLSSIKQIIDGYHKYRCDSMLVEDRNRLEALIAGLKVRTDNDEE